MNRFIASARIGVSTIQSSSHIARAASAIRHFHPQPTANVRRAAPTTKPAATWNASSLLASYSPSTAFASRTRVGFAPLLFTGRRHMSSSSNGSSLINDAVDAVSTVVEPLPIYSPPLSPDGFWSYFHFLPRTAQDLLIYLHSHMPAEWIEYGWLPTILIATVTIRLCLFPMAVMQQKNTAGITLMKPELQAMNQRQAETKQKYQTAGLQMPIEVMLEHRRESKALFTKWKANPWRALIMPLSMFPVFISMFVGLRTMGYVDPSFLEGGILWFQNLGWLDQGFNDAHLQLGPLRLSIGLPLVNSALIAASVYFNSELQSDTSSRMAVIMRKFMYGMALLSWPFCSSGIPAGVLVYWIFSNIYGIAQAKLLRSDYGRKLFGIPKLPKPLEDMDASFNKLNNLFNNRNAPASDARAINPFAPPGTSQPPTVTKTTTTPTATTTTKKSGPKIVPTSTDFYKPPRKTTKK